jgi:hypothetical protein
MSKLDDICYHMYESSGNSKYVLAGRKSIHPDEAKKHIKDLIFELIEESCHERVKQEARKDGYETGTRLLKRILKKKVEAL